MSGGSSTPTALSGLPICSLLPLAPSHLSFPVSRDSPPALRAGNAAPLHSAAQYLLSERVDPLLQVGGLCLDDTGILDDGITGTTQDSLLSKFTDHGKLEDRRYDDFPGRFQEKAKCFAQNTSR